MNVINATPHALHIIGNDGAVAVTIEPSGVVARCTVERMADGEVNGIPVNSTVYGKLGGLPDEERGTMYVVSSLAAIAGKVEGRSDLLVPDDVVRDEDGKIIGCRALART